MIWITPLLAAAALWAPTHAGRVCRTVGPGANLCVHMTFRSLDGDANSRR